MGILQARILEWVALASSRDLPDPGIEPRLLWLLHWQVDSLPLRSLGRPHVPDVCVANRNTLIVSAINCSTAETSRYTLVMVGVSESGP